MAKKIILGVFLFVSIFQNLHCSNNSSEITPLSQLQAIRVIMLEHVQKCVSYFDSALYQSFNVSPLYPSSVHSLPLAVAFTGHAALRVHNSPKIFQEPVKQAALSAAQSSTEQIPGNTTSSVAPIIEQEAKIADTVSIMISPNAASEQKTTAVNKESSFVKTSEDREWSWNWSHTTAAVPVGVIIWAVGNLIFSQK